MPVLDETVASVPFSARIVQRRTNGFWRQQKARIVRNKWAARQFAIEHGVPVPRLLWEGRDPANIPFSALPDCHVIKGSRGCAGRRVYVIAHGRELFGRASRPVRIIAALRTGQQPGERILVEEFIKVDGATTIPPDYKVHTFCGHVGAITYVDRNRPQVDRSFDVDWNPLPFPLQNWDRGEWPQRPSQLDDLIEYAQRLSTAFGSYIRLDFLLTDRGFVLGETCGTPWGGEGFTAEADDYLGRLWDEHVGGGP